MAAENQKPATPVPAAAPAAAIPAVTVKSAPKPDRPTKTIRLPITVTVKDDERSRDEVRHEGSGLLLEPAFIATKDIPGPDRLKGETLGPAVTLDAVEAVVLLKRWADKGAVEIKNGKEVAPTDADHATPPKVED